jgi:hypothetical protein
MEFPAAVVAETTTRLATALVKALRAKAMMAEQVLVLITTLVEVEAERDLLDRRERKIRLTSAPEQEEQV